MNATTALILDLLQRHNGDEESTARFMRDQLRIGGIRVCRDLIRRNRPVCSNCAQWQWPQGDGKTADCLNRCAARGLAA